MKTHPFRLYGASCLRRIEQRVATALDRWSVEWSDGSRGFLIEPVALDEDAESGEGLPLCRTGSTGWVAWSDWQALEQHLAATLFPAWDAAVAFQGELAAMVLRQAGLALLDEIASAFGSQPSSVEKFAETGWPVSLGLGRGAGALRIRLPSWDGVSLLLSGDLLDAWLSIEQLRCKQPPALVGTLIEAVSSQPVRLVAFLGSAEISLAELATLAPGDVIQLGSARAAPIELRTADGRVVCKSYLGAREKRRALRIISS